MRPSARQNRPGDVCQLFGQRTTAATFLPRRPWAANTPYDSLSVMCTAYVATPCTHHGSAACADRISSLLLIHGNRCFPPLECSRGVSPTLEAICRPGVGDCVASPTTTTPVRWRERSKAGHWIDEQDVEDVQRSLRSRMICRSPRGWRQNISN